MKLPVASSSSCFAGVEDADIAVFRFTLGIPGFNDALLPRLVGILGAALLMANHLSDQGTATAAQAMPSLTFLRDNKSLTIGFYLSCQVHAATSREG